MKYLKLFLVILLALIIFSCTNNKLKYEEEVNKYLANLWEGKDYDWIFPSVTIHKEKVYFGNWNKEYCKVDLKTGELNWKFQTGDQCYFKPVFTTKGIHFTSFDLYLYTIDSLGRLVWKKEVENVVKNSLINHKRSIYVNVRSTGFYALDSNNGEELWKIAQGPTDLSTSQPILYKDTIFIGDLNNKFYAIDAVSGKTLWEKEYKLSISSPPEVNDKIVVLGVDPLEPAIPFVIALNRNTGNELWNVNYKLNIRHKPLLYNGNFYFGTDDDRVICLDAENGSMKWETPEKAGVGTDLIGFNGKIYYGTYGSIFSALNAETGESIIRVSLPGITNPILYNNDVYIGGNGTMYKVR